MSSASVSTIRTYAHHGWRIVSGLGLGSVILLSAIIIAARITRDLPSLREQLVDRERCFRCRQAGRR